MKGHSREASRDLDRRAAEEYGIPTICLMENAGAGAARLAMSLLAREGAVVCVCGPGNNGGDGMVVARHVLLAGRPARVLLLPPRGGGDPPGDAGVQLRICRALRIPVTLVEDEARAGSAAAEFHGAALLVDALFGTGLDRPVAGPAEALIHRMNEAGVPILALDIPSGLDCDTGAPLGTCVRAVATATFAAPKLGFDDPRAREWTGDVHVIGIGAPPA